MSNNLSRKSDWVLTCLLMAFLVMFMTRLPDNVLDRFKDSTNAFSNAVATNYQAHLPAAATVKDLSEIMPAAGDTTPPAAQ